MMADTLERLGAVCGLLSPAIFLIATAIAIASYHGYNPATDYISHLGVDPHTYLIFNIGVALSGIAGMVFAKFLWFKLPPGLTRVGTLLLGIGLLSFTLLSVFTEDSFQVHMFFASIFFGLSFFAFLLIGTGLFAENRIIGAFSILMAGLIIPLPLSGLTPLSEHIAVGAIIVWSLGMWAVFGWEDKSKEYAWLWAEY